MPSIKRKSLGRNKKMAGHKRGKGGGAVAGRGKEGVELAGIEPASAQGNHTLSTRLFWTSFSSVSKTQTTN